MPNQKKIRVFIADNEELFREGLARILATQSDIEVVGQSSAERDVTSKAREAKPDVLVVDSHIPESDIADIVSEVKKSLPRTKVVTVSHPESADDPIELLKAGVAACLARTISADDIVRSIRLVSSGRIIISPLLARQMLTEIRTLTEGETADIGVRLPISERELEIVKMISYGATNKEIASELDITLNTVKVHVKNILEKLKTRNRQQLAVYAVLHGWVEAPLQQGDESSGGKEKEQS